MYVQKQYKGHHKLFAWVCLKNTEYYKSNVAPKNYDNKTDTSVGIESNPTNRYNVIYVITGMQKPH